MAYLSTIERVRIRELIATKQEQLDKANQTYSELLSQETQEYRFDSGEGSQRAIKRSLKELKEQIDSLQSEIEGLNRKLRGGGLVNTNVRRK